MKPEIKPLSGLTIITNEKTVLNNASAIDGIGSLRASIPPDINRRLGSRPEFDWVWETNEGVETFCRLNPQFDIRYRASFKTMPDMVVNKDGGLFSLSKMRFTGTTNVR